MTADLLDHLARWVDELHHSSVTATFFRGPGNPQKRAAWAVVEGSVVAGQVTVWDSGEVELEAYNSRSSAVVLAETATAQDEGELDAILSRLLAACEQI